VGGSDRESKIKEYLSGIPDWTKEAWDRPELQGVLIALDTDGKALSITRIRHAVPEPRDGEGANTAENAETVSEAVNDNGV
jgi:calcineurin-like phosphoesterase